MPTISLVNLLSSSPAVLNWIAERGIKGEEDGDRRDEGCRIAGPPHDQERRIIVDRLDAAREIKMRAARECKKTDAT